MAARIKSLTALAATIVAGLATRSGSALVPAFVAEFGGDTLWATALFLAIRSVLNRLATRWVALLAAAGSLAVELSQLWRTPWLDALRSTRLGMLTLGNGFLYSDLLCYAVGVALAAALDRLLHPEVRA